MVVKVSLALVIQASNRNEYCTMFPFLHVKVILPSNIWQNIMDLYQLPWVSFTFVIHENWGCHKFDLLPVQKKKIFENLCMAFPYSTFLYIIKY